MIALQSYKSCFCLGLLSSFLISSGCQDSSKYQSTKNKLKETENQLALERQVQSSNQQRVDELLAQIAENEDELEGEQKRIFELNETIANLNSTFADKELEIAEIELKLAGTIGDRSALEQELARAQTELLEAQSGLAAAVQSLTEAENAKQSLQFESIQAFLETLGPYRDYVLGNRDLRKVYEIAENKNCLFMFSFGDQLENLSTNYSGILPQISNYEVLPLGLKFQKLVVCEESSDEIGKAYQVHRENGRIFKVFPKGQSGRVYNHSLLTSRDSSSCDQLDNETLTANVFANRYQFIYPHYSPLNIIESIGLLRPSNTRMDYKMSSTVREFYAPSCEELLTRSNPSPLALVACQLINDIEVNEANVSNGCFTESGPAGAKPSLIFNPSEL